MKKNVFLPAFFALCLCFPALSNADDSDDRKTFTITMKGHQFEPLELVVPANQKLKIIVKNEDSSPIEFESVKLDREKIVQPANEITVLFNPLQPGTYEYFDDFHSGSKGFITVQ